MRKSFVKKYLVTKNKDGTEKKILIDEEFSESVPSKEELQMKNKKRNRLYMILFVSLYVIITAIIMYYGSKF